MQFNDAAGACPNCQVKPLSIWQRMIASYWLTSLAMGLALQIVSRHSGPHGGPIVANPFEVASISQFITGTVIFSAVAAMLLFAVDRIRTAFRGRTGLRHRRDARRRHE